MSVLHVTTQLPKPVWVPAGDQFSLGAYTFVSPGVYVAPRPSSHYQLIPSFLDEAGAFTDTAIPEGLPVSNGYPGVPKKIRKILLTVLCDQNSHTATLKAHPNLLGFLQVGYEQRLAELFSRDRLDPHEVYDLKKSLYKLTIFVTQLQNDATVSLKQRDILKELQFRSAFLLMFLTQASRIYATLLTSNPSPQLITSLIDTYGELPVLAVLNFNHLGIGELANKDDVLLDYLVHHNCVTIRKTVIQKDTQHCSLLKDTVHLKRIPQLTLTILKWRTTITAANLIIKENLTEQDYLANDLAEVFSDYTVLLKSMLTEPKPAVVATPPLTSVLSPPEQPMSKPISLTLEPSLSLAQPSSLDDVDDGSLDTSLLISVLGGSSEEPTKGVDTSDDPRPPTSPVRPLFPVHSPTVEPPTPEIPPVTGLDTEATGPIPEDLVYVPTSQTPGSSEKKFLEGAVFFSFLGMTQNESLFVWTLSFKKTWAISEILSLSHSLSVEYPPLLKQLNNVLTAHGHKSLLAVPSETNCTHFVNPNPTPLHITLKDII